jgi:HK97 family phage major capsid protein
MLVLKEVLAKNPADLTDEEKAFLKENIANLNDNEKATFAEVLKGDDDEEEKMDIDAVKKMVSKHIEDNLAKKVDEISDSILAKFKTGVEKQRKNAINGGDNGEDKGKDTTRLFMKALLRGDKEACKALTTSTTGTSPDDADAGLLIPTELRAEVLRIAETQYGLARRDMMYLPFSGPGNTRTIPTLGTSVTVKWTDEGEKKTSTQPKFSIVTQTLKKLAAIVPLTEEILEDSAINLTQLLGALFAEAVSKEEDLQFFAGTGAPWTGILNNGLVNKVVQASGAASQLTADDLLDMIDATPTGALAGAKFYFHRTILSVLRKLKGSDGQYIYQAPANGLPGTIWNYPYETSDAFPALSTVTDGDQYILFGNLKQGAIFGDKQQLRVKLLDQATITDSDGSTVINLAEQDMVALRIVERVGYVVALPAALTVLEADAQQS